MTIFGESCFLDSPSPKFLKLLCLSRNATRSRYPLPFSLLTSCSSVIPLPSPPSYPFAHQPRHNNRCFVFTVEMSPLFFLRPPLSVSVSLSYCLCACLSLCKHDLSISSPVSLSPYFCLTQSDCAWLPLSKDSQRKAKTDGRNRKTRLGEKRKRSAQTYHTLHVVFAPVRKGQRASANQRPFQVSPVTSRTGTPSLVTSWRRFLEGKTPSIFAINNSNSGPRIRKKTFQYVKGLFLAPLSPHCFLFLLYPFPPTPVSAPTLKNINQWFTFVWSGPW